MKVIASVGVLARTLRVSVMRWLIAESESEFGD